ncbi:bacteriochlorophyll 4-vinyl reductase [Rhodoplanes serenus]|uniref:bacteriochlorophyll 4-vinyl reductase n=1 Tax=Rhodoplanes serenus TaxID=200615 RepID=UPI001FE0D9BB|nr:bacteriochlorophyll 4-vinyl reductase [Rhodoplanes serenus]
MTSAVEPLSPVAPSRDHAAAAGDAVARIGPNAIIRMIEALDAAVGDGETARLFAAAGLAHHLTRAPDHMVDERDVVAIHTVVRDALGIARAREVAAVAGRLTADYLLANRIPKPVQPILKILPARLAARILLGAIGQHAWTFAGSGVFSHTLGHPVRFEIAGCPICRGAMTEAAAPLCDYYGATFQHLFRTLVHRAATVTETACQAAGASACRFEIRWR